MACQGAGVVLRGAEPDDDQRVTQGEVVLFGDRRQRRGIRAPAISAAHLLGQGRDDVPDRVSAATESLMPQKNSPRCTSGPTWCSANSNSVTTPKLPPPPRIAQNRSGCSSAEARTRRPSGQDHGGGDQVVAAEPVLLGHPAHAAAEREPADAGVADTPPGTASPWAWVAPSTSAHGRASTDLSRGGAPGRRAPRACALRSIMRPPSQTAVPLNAWPPPRTAISSPSRCAYPRAATTSSCVWHWVNAAGRRSMSPFQTARARRSPLRREGAPTR